MANPPQKINLAARHPFSLTSVVRSHGWAQLAPFKFHPESGALTYLDRLPDGRVTELTITETTAGVQVRWSDELQEDEIQSVSRRVTWMLGLDQDFTPFYALASAEPKLAGMEKMAQGRVLRSPTLFEDIVKTILTTNTSWAGTIRMVARLVSGFGDPLPSDPNRHAFPTPERLATTTEEALRSTAGLGYRAPYVVDLAQAVASGDLALEALKHSDLPTHELRRRLLAIKGVGGYAAANLLMILGRYDYLPVDSWALKVVAHEWYDGKPVGKDEVEAAFEHWGAWKGLAYWFWDWSLLTQT